MVFYFKFQIQISVGNNTVLTAAMTELRDIWEETSFVLERRQANVHCVQQEQEGLKNRCAPPYTLTFDPDALLPITKTIGEFVATIFHALFSLFHPSWQT